MLTRIFFKEKEALIFQREVKGTLIVKYDYDYFKKKIVKVFLVKFKQEVSIDARS